MKFIKSFVIALPFIGAGIVYAVTRSIDTNLSFLFALGVFILLISLQFWIRHRAPQFRNLIGFIGYSIVQWSGVTLAAPEPPQTAPASNEHYRLASFFYDHNLRLDKKSGNDFIYKYKNVKLLVLSTDGWHLIRAGQTSVRAITDLDRLKSRLIVLTGQIDDIVGQVEELQKEQAKLKAEQQKQQQANQQKQNQNNNGNNKPQQNGNNNQNQQQRPQQQNGGNNKQSNSGWQQPNIQRVAVNSNNGNNVQEESEN